MRILILLLSATLAHAQAVSQEDDDEVPPQPAKVVPTTVDPPPPANPPLQLMPEPLYRLPPPRIEQHRTWELFSSGASMAGLFWLIGGSVGATLGDYEMLVPVVGPFVEMRHFTGDAWIVNIPLAMTGLVEASGVVMMIVGATVKHKVELPGGLRISAAPAREGGTLVLTGRF